MTTEQRKAHLKKFESAPLRLVSVRSCVRQHCASADTSTSLQMPGVHSLVRDGDPNTAPQVCALSIPAEECGIHTLSFETVSAMWVKAEQYLNSERDIVPAPGSDSKAMMVASKSSNAPHFVNSTVDGL